MGFHKKEQITILLTSNCNMKCYYCYMPKLRVLRQDREIDVNFAKKGIRDYFESGRRKSIRFFSPGEPTMAFDLMREIVDFAKSITNEEISFELQTNGNFDSKIASWIEEHINVLWISCDGDLTIQRRQRPSIINGVDSSEVVENNIRRFVRHKSMQFGVRATIADENLYKQIDIIDYFNSLGVQYVSSAPMYRSITNRRITKNSLLDFARGFVPAFFRAKELGMFYQNLMIVNFDEEVDIYCQSSIPTPRLTPDGFVSCCDWASLGPSYLPKGILHELIIGKYDANSDSIIYFNSRILNISKRNVHNLSLGACRNCEIIRHCAGGCVGKIASVTNDIFTVDRDWCRATLYLYKHLHKYISSFPVINP